MSGDALVFTLARLGPPALSSAEHTRFLPRDLLPDRDALAAESLGPPDAAGFAGRVLGDVGRGGGLGGGTSGVLKLPQSFGAVYLGQSFAGLITASNVSAGPITAVGIKVELSTERGRAALLYDSTSQALPKLEAGQRHDFAVKHDVKELGTHSLVCSATYVTPDGERRVQGQAFSFTAANPLVVRTKQRTVGDAVLLEASLENATRAPMLLDAISFFPSPPWAAERIGGGGAATLPPPAQTTGGSAAAQAGPLSTYIAALPVIPEGGSSAFLFRLTRPAGGAAGSPRGRGPAGSPTSSGTTAAGAAGAAAGAASDPPAGPLGRMEIKWRGPMGEVARLQTQQISLPPQPTREASLALARLPPCAVLGEPFSAVLRVQSHVDRRLGPLKIAAAHEGQGPGSTSSSPSRPSHSRRSGSSGAEAAASASRESSLHAGGALPRSASSASTPGAAAGGAAAGPPPLPGSPPAVLPPLVGVCLDGAQAAIVDELGPRAAVEVRLQLRALSAGQLALPALALSNERDGRLYATLPPAELFVYSC
ncbi:hypothetical protein COHA_009523 [Chlorella ohadii]|uniref:Trafficking protein particle complex subunit 13 N-terminal domain-containing protein n=1 Tax=Chlorella ohadii TaxID=2649997 RepID=A0AAD5DHX3_9CHLO|nr:hypothetical protein COHA_009523 [Chlorella ohadii]